MYNVYNHDNDDVYIIIYIMMTMMMYISLYIIIYIILIIAAAAGQGKWHLGFARPMDTPEGR